MGSLYLGCEDRLLQGSKQESLRWDPWITLDQGPAFLSLAGTRKALFAGTPEGMRCSYDQGASWETINEGLAIPHIRSVGLWLTPNRSTLFAGTQPAGIFYSGRRGDRWYPCPEVMSLREQYGWRLPYAPEAGCVRGFAFQGDVGYAAVEQGGMLITRDGGEVWELAEGSSGDPDFPGGSGYIHSDVHDVTLDPQNQKRIYAPTGGGLYRSEDQGASWERLHPAYCRAVWIDPDRSDRLVLGTAAGPDRGGEVLESRDRGGSWEPVHAGIKAPWPSAMVESFATSGSDLLALLSHGALLGARRDDLDWREIFPADSGRADTSEEENPRAESFPAEIRIQSLLSVT